MVCPSNNFCLLVDWSNPFLFFDLLEGFKFSSRGRFYWGPPLCCSASTTLWNVEMTSSILLSNLWNLKVLLILSFRTLFLSLVMSFIITDLYKWEFRRITTLLEHVSKLTDNEPWNDGVAYHPLSYSGGDCHRFSVHHKGTFIGNYCGNVYPSFSLFLFCSSFHYTYIEWIHIIQTLQIHKLQHQIRVSLYACLVVIQI